MRRGHDRVVVRRGRDRSGCEEGMAGAVVRRGHGRVVVRRGRGRSGCEERAWQEWL